MSTRFALSRVLRDDDSIGRHLLRVLAPCAPGPVSDVMAEKLFADLCQFLGVSRRLGKRVCAPRLTGAPIMTFANIYVHWLEIFRATLFPSRRLEVDRDQFVHMLRTDKHRYDSFYEPLKGANDGAGAFGEVRRVRERHTGAVRAAKQIKMSPTGKVNAQNGRYLVSEKEVMRELQSLRELDHPNVLKVFDGFLLSTDGLTCLVTELCDGGSLRQILYTHGAFSESIVRHLTFQLLRGLAYIHKKGVVHKDIKPHNIMLREAAQPDRAPVLKIIDFGLAEGPGAAKGGSGTAAYKAPEVAKRRPMGAGLADEFVYDGRSDVWSVGVVAFELLTFFPPTRNTRFQLKEPQREEWQVLKEHVSPVGYHFIKMLLEPDDADRPDSTTALHHPWFRQGPEPPMPLVPAPMTEEVKANLLALVGHSQFHVLFLNLLAHFLHPSHELVSLFLAVDADLDGEVGRDEFLAWLKRHGFSQFEAVSVFTRLDSRASDRVTFTQFLAGTHTFAPADVARLEGFFRRYAVDGRVDAAGLGVMLGADMTDRQFRPYFRRLDRDNDGWASWDDLVAYLQA